VINTATVTAPGGVPDPVPANNSSSVTTAILAPDLTITKTHSGNFTVGVNGVYTITVSNSVGSLSSTGTITVTDTLPAGLGFVSAVGTGWSCGFAAGTVTCTTSNVIAAGASASPITLTVSVAPNAAPSVLNFATVSGGGEPGTVTGNNTASDNTVVGTTAVNVFQPDNAQTATPGTVLFYAHTFTAGSAGTLAFSTSAIAVPAVPGWTQIVYRDTDCNGTLSAAEGVTPFTATIAVNAGDTVCIVVKDSIPATAPYNARSVISVIATFNGSQTLTRTDTTTVGSVAGAGLVLTKSVRNVTLGSGPGTANTARPQRHPRVHGELLQHVRGRALVDRHHRRHAELHHVPVGRLHPAAAGQHLQLHGHVGARGERRRLGRLDARRHAALGRQRQRHLPGARVSLTD
jgi:uncharacterized repeat protein (TIGR01451 family)